MRCGGCNVARCGVKVEAVPWAQGKQTLTRSYMQFLATWARRVSWQEVARFFHTSWEKVFHSVCAQVEWGLAHRDLSGIQVLGIDETSWQRGHRYLTVVYQLDAQARRLLWVGEQRSARDAAAVLPVLRPRAHPAVAFHLQ